MPARADPVAGSGLDVHYEQLRHAALHHRAEAFPLGLGVLASNGVIAWHRVVAHLTPTIRRHSPPGDTTTATGAGQLAGQLAGRWTPPVEVTGEEVTGELVSILAAMTLVPT